MRRATVFIFVAATLGMAGACSSDTSPPTGSGGTAGAHGGAGGGTGGGAGTSPGGAAGTSAGGTSGNAGASGSGGGGGNTAADTFACGAVRCMRGKEYCFFEEWNGATKIDHQCRPMPAGCTTCGCAKQDAAPATMMCETAARLTCTDAGTVINDQASSQSLSVLCLVA
jgi:hypothetical protein